MIREEENLKRAVREKYARIAEQGNDENVSTCCGTTSASSEVYNIMVDDYSGTEGYVAEADLGLGCGLPTHFAKIRPGNTVIDLGSGAGNDCFVARHEVGPEGKVIGIDFTRSMIQKARENAEKLGYNNVEFREGDIDEMPVNDNSADVIVSNCVLNLVPDKPKVLSEIFRVLRPGGHFSISDIVLVGELPDALREDAEMYAGCVSGAIQKSTYLNHMAHAGFENLILQKEKPIALPDDILSKYLSDEAIRSFIKEGTGIFSITVYGEKPGKDSKPLEKKTTEGSSEPCLPGNGCC